MYRQYEDARKLEKQLAELKKEYDETTDEDRLISLGEAIASLKDRINYAWQDEEYEEDY